MRTNINEIVNTKTGQRIRFEPTISTKSDTLRMVATYPSLSKEPPEHYHPKQHEHFKVVYGRIAFRINGEVRHFDEGATIHLKPGDRHAMWNDSLEDAVVTWEVSPSLHTEDFLREMTMLANSPQSDKNGIPGPFESLMMLGRYADMIRLTKIPALALLVCKLFSRVTAIRNQGSSLFKYYE